MNEKNIYISHLFDIVHRECETNDSLHKPHTITKEQLPDKLLLYDWYLSAQKKWKYSYYACFSI